MNTSLQIQDSVATIEINRPKQLNALNTEVLQELHVHIDSIEASLRESRNAQPRVVLLRGAGAKAFVAGADVSELASLNDLGLAELIRLGQGVMHRLSSIPVCVVAAVDGFALGGGCELALAADLIAASSEAVFGLPEVGLGVIPGFGGTQRLTARIGVGRAKRIIFSTEKLSAREAYEIGLCEYLFEASEYEEKLAALVTELAESAPLAVAAAKRCIEHAAGLSATQGFYLEAQSFLSVRGTADAQQGLEAFLKKEKASFEGR